MYYRVIMNNVLENYKYRFHFSYSVINQQSQVQATNKVYHKWTIITLLLLNWTNMCPWSTKAVFSRWGIFVAIANNTLYGSKLYIFLLCQKSLEY